MSMISRDEELDGKVVDKMRAFFVNGKIAMKTDEFLNSFEWLSPTKISNADEFDWKIVNFMFATACNVFMIWTLHYFYLF